MEVQLMRFSWLRDERQNYWELLRDARDEVQYLVHDTNSDMTYFRLGIEPTTFGEKSGPRFKMEDGVMVACDEEDVNCHVVLEEDDLGAFLRNKCSFYAARVPLPTEKYGANHGDVSQNCLSDNNVTQLQNSSYDSDKSFRFQTIREDFVKNFCGGEESSPESSSVKYLTKTIYESGEYCIYQYHHVVQLRSKHLQEDLLVEAVNLNDNQNSSSGNHDVVTSRDTLHLVPVRPVEQIVGKLCRGECLIVALNCRDIDRFTVNHSGFLISPSLLGLLQNIRRSSSLATDA